MTNSNIIKIGISLALISISVVYLSINHYIPTNYARDTFFYADYFVSNSILSDGFIKSSKEIYVPNEWGKIGSQTSLPMLPIHLATIELISTVPIERIYTTIPAFLLSALALYSFCKRIGLTILSTIPLVLAGAIAAPATPFYPIAAATLSQGMLYIGCLIILIHFCRANNMDDSTVKARLPTTILTIVVMLYLFFRYPTSHLILTLVFIVSVVFIFRTENAKHMELSIIVIAISIGLLVIGLPLSSYVRNAQIVLIQVVSFEFASPTSANTFTYPTAYPPKYYSLLPLIFLLPVSVIGGLLTIKSSIIESNIPSIVAVSWGIAVLLLSLAYFANSTSWLIGRSLFLALPVMILGASNALRRISVPISSVVSIGILSLVLISLILQLGLPQTQIKSYEPGVERGSTWTGTYSEEKVTTDHKLGAPAAANGDFNVVYPRNYTRAHATFYTQNYSSFHRNTNDLVILSEGMTQYGLLVMESDHTPIPEHSFSIRVENSNKIFTNGNSTVISTRNI